jgi:hypothetical protein
MIDWDKLQKTLGRCNYNVEFHSTKEEAAQAIIMKVTGNRVAATCFGPKEWIVVVFLCI